MRIPAKKTARLRCCLAFFLAVHAVSAQHSLEYEPHHEPELPLTNRLPFKLQRRYQHKNNVPSGYIFNKHLRKCGGTTLRQYLEDVCLYYQNLKEHAATLDVDDSDAPGPKMIAHAQQFGNVTYYEQEAYAMDWQCPKHDAQRWRDSLNVIALRNPLERHLSEFFYSGPGRHSRLKELHKEQNYNDGEFAHLLRIELPKWIEEGMAVTRKRGCLRRHFSDEFQVRALSGELSGNDKGPLPYSSIDQDCSVHILSNGTFVNNAQCGNCNIFCDGPCSYGNHWRGGIRGGGEITGESLERAKSILRNFDVVLITEMMSEEDTVQMMADITGVPLGKGNNCASLLTDEKKVRAFGEAIATVEQKMTHYQSILKEAKADDMLQLIERHSQYEILLYEEAKQINREIVAQWKEERKSQFESQSR